MSERTLIVDDTGVVRRWRGGREVVRWDALARVEIVTTDDGPFVEDFFWLLVADDGVTGVCLGGAEAEAVQLLRVLSERLSGLDHEAVIRACASGEPARFVVWEDSRFLTQSNCPGWPAARAAAGDRVVPAPTAGWWSRLLSWWA